MSVGEDKQRPGAGYFNALRFMGDYPQMRPQMVSILARLNKDRILSIYYDSELIVEEGFHSLKAVVFSSI